MKRLVIGAALVGIVGLGATRAEASNFSFTGNFTTDDNVQLFTFSVGVASNVTLRTWSYAGGVNAAGNTILRGGFDPILAVFSSTGGLIGQNDDGGGNVSPDSVTGARYDTFLQVALAAGNYSVTVMQYDNFANGPNLSNGFIRTGQGNFTGALSSCQGNGSFEDVTGGPGCQRDNHWAFDILNVTDAVVVPRDGSPVPEPASLILLGSGLAAVVRQRRKNRQAR